MMALSNSATATAAATARAATTTRTATAYDLRSGCHGVIAAVHVVVSMSSSRPGNRGHVVNAERLSKGLTGSRGESEGEITRESRYRIPIRIYGRETNYAGRCIGTIVGYRHDELPALCSRHH